MVLQPTKRSLSLCPAEGEFIALEHICTALFYWAKSTLDVSLRTQRLRLLRIKEALP